MGRSAKPVVYKGDTFDSLADLAAAFDMSPCACRARLKKGIPLEAPFGSCKRVIYQGKEWYSVSHSHLPALSTSTSAFFQLIFSSRAIAATLA